MEQSSNTASRRDALKTLATFTVPFILGTVSSAPADAAAEAAEQKISAIPLSVLQSIAGGSAEEFEKMKATFSPTSPLQGLDLALYQLYRYAAIKAPAMDDPRQSLRGLFVSRNGDALYQYVVESGTKLKVYDARGDGLTNVGKGGVIKGTNQLLSALKEKGVIEDFTVDSSAHQELQWEQANPSVISLTVKKPAGLGASMALEAEKVGIPLSLVTQAIQGYYKQCKVAVSPEITKTADGESIKLNLSWAGKARQKGTMERRANDKLNAARGYKE